MTERGGLISLWPYSRERDKREVIVAHKSDIREVQFFIDAGEIPAPDELFYLVPNARKCPEVPLYWLKYERFPTFQIEVDSSETASFFRLWEDFCHAALIAQPDILESLLKNAPLPVWDAVPSLEYVGDYIGHAFGAPLWHLLCAAGPYTDYPPEVGIKNWWRHEPTGMTSLGSIIERLKEFRRTSDSFSSGLETAEELSRLIRGLRNNKVDAALDSATTLCLIAGALALRQGQNALAVVLFHRSLDFFLQGRCMEHGLLKETGFGLEFLDTVRDIKVGAASCYRALTQSRQYMPKKRVTNAIQACNDIRNNLLLTHSVYGASNAYAVRYRDAINECICGVDASVGRKVISACERFLEGICLQPRLIFCMEADLRNCVVSAESLTLSSVS